MAASKDLKSPVVTIAAAKTPLDHVCRVKDGRVEITLDEKVVLTAGQALAVTIEE